MAWGSSSRRLSAWISRACLSTGARSACTGGSCRRHFALAAASAAAIAAPVAAAAAAAGGGIGPEVWCEGRECSSSATALVPGVAAAGSSGSDGTAVVFFRAAAAAVAAAAAAAVAAAPGGGRPLMRCEGPACSATDTAPGSAAAGSEGGGSAGTVPKLVGAELDEAFRGYQKFARGTPGPRVYSFDEALRRRGLSRPNGEEADAQASAKDLADELACLKAAFDLLDFADFATAMLRALEEAEGARPEDVREAMGEKAARLYEHFVFIARGCGGVPAAWASACRNALAPCFAFPLLGGSEAAALAAQLRSLGALRVVDPMAGTGLHARLLHTAGLEVRASDVRPSEGIAGGAGWWPVDVRRTEEALVASPAGASAHAVADGDAGADCADGVASGGDSSAAAAATALLLSWPPSSSPAALLALRRFGGGLVVLIGDRGRWTGCQGLHEELAQHWEEVWRLDILRWPRMEDDVRVFRRRR